MPTLTAAQRFYSHPAPRPFTRQDVLDGLVIKLNPALITITDGLVSTTNPLVLQQQVYAHVQDLLAHSIRTFHLDINFPDYQGFGPSRPDINTAVFTPAFVARLNDMVRSHQAFLNLHLLTAEPHRHLRAFAQIPLGAICFQLDAVATAHQLAALVENIWRSGACVSPVIETVGSGTAPVLTADAVRARLEPVLPKIGMLTLQAAATGARSNQDAGDNDYTHLHAYMRSVRPGFQGTFQVQGGITTRTIGAAVRTGAEFLVAGTELFHDPRGRAPHAVAKAMLEEAARVMIDAEGGQRSA